MSGIDKIIKHIEDDTNAVCEEIITSAQNKAEAILSKAREDAAKIQADSEKILKDKVVDIKKRSDSAAELEERKTLLCTKQDIIDEMLGKGLQEVKSLQDEAYFELILKMIEKNSLEQNGEIKFSDKDKKRMPKEYISEINKVSRGKLTLSPESAAIDAGFILVYGGIDENCSFDAIFASENETLKDKAGKLLF